MNHDVIRTLPLAILKDMQNLLSVFQDLYKSNSDIIFRIEGNENDILQFKNRENEEFTFQISSPRIQHNKIVYQCKFKPSNESNFEGQSGLSELNTLINWFNSWINFLRELNKYRTLLSEPFLKEYTDEFFSEFEFIEEEDDDNPYETQKQIALYNAIVDIELRLKSQEQNEIVEEILKETSELKDNIQNISKGATKKMVAKIFAKIKKGGIKLFKDVVEVGYKEIIKAALNSGTDVIGQLL